jgi:PAS domain S-box-containing protein
MKKNNGDKSSSEILHKKAEDLLKEKSEAKILELIEELAFQNEEKAKRADALLIANKELIFQNKEKTKRADELFIANKELAFQNEEKAKRAAELFIANKELAFQNEEKAKRADELRIANKELAFQAELIVANNKAVKLTVELELYQTELEMQNKELSCAKEKAETDARKYAELYDSAPSGYFTLSNDGTITLANNSGATMLGKDRSQIKDNRFGFFVSNDTLTIFNLFLVKVFSGNANETCDVTLSIMGNLPMYVHLTGIVTENGKECLLTMVDITESRMLVELHQSEQRYHALVDWSPYAVIVHRNLKIVYANPAAIMMFGATCAQDLVGTRVLDRIHPDCHQIVQERIRRGIEHGIDAVMSEFKYFKLDGTIIIAEAQGTTITYDGVPCILASMRDITERTRIENLLHDTNLKLDLAMDMAGTGWWEMDIPTGSVIFSKHNSEMLGYAPESFKHSRDLTNLIHPEDYDRTMNAMQGHLNGLFERYEVEYRIKTKSGEYIWFYDNGSVVKKDANGKPLTVSGIVINTTARKHAEHEIEQSHARFSAMISNISDVIAIMDADGFKKYESPNLKKHFGWLPEDNAGRSAFSFIHPDDMEYALKDFYSVLGEDRSVKTMEFRFECKDGSYKPIELTASNLLNDPLINGIMVSFRDITDRKIAEETLRENDARYSSMISNISDVIGIMGADGIMTYKSSNIEKWFGWLPQDRIGTSGFSTVHPDDMEYVGKVFYSLLEKDNAIATLEFRYQCKDGSYKPIELTAANLLNDPAINGVLLNYHDITGRRQTENILRKTNAQLESAVVTANEMTQLAEASSKSKSTFLANMSHEIRTPLNAIIGFSQLMNREKSLTDSQRNYVTSINSAGEHLLKLINDILELSKLGAGRMEINPTNFDLHAVFNEVQMMFKELSLSKRLQLVVELSGDLPHNVIADSHKLRQILINLIGNAIKFTDKGSIFVRASVDKRNKDTSRLVVEIQDTGPGISEDELGKLFKQFEQTSAGILKNSGTGLGLALSRELAVLMGGNITVASEEGKGSVFTIHVALKEGKSEVGEAANAKRVICIDNPQKAYRVLVVDDKQENRQVVVNLLNLTGFETKEAVNGEDAVSKFEAWEPHLILMDVRMPVMDGYEATRLIKSTEKGRQTPVIAVTASSPEEEKKNEIAFEIQGYVRKPFNESELFGTIGKVLGLEFIYEEEKPINAPSRYLGNDELIEEDLAKLPDDLILLMLTAVKSANLSHLIEIINGIEIGNSELSKHLMTLAVDYRYDHLLQLLNKRK